MSDILEAIILGIVQGLTEFLPVSSSGHLEIFKFLFGEDASAEQSLLMTVTLHGATALSTVVVFRKEIVSIIKDWFQPGFNQGKKWTLYILVSMIPAALFFLLLEDWVTSLFEGALLLVSLMLLLTGVLLLIADHPFLQNKKLKWLNAILIGTAQAIAIIPGISRSGATIATAVMMGLKREVAARFSFLMVLPLIFGKILLDLLDGDYTSQGTALLPLILGATAAFVVGWVACRWMIKLVRESQLKYFAWYCFIVGTGFALYAVI